MDILLFWTPPNVETYYFKLPRVRAIKFNPVYKDVLALSFYDNFVRSNVALYGVIGLKLKIVIERNCCNKGALNVLAWHSQGYFLIAGTNRGHIVVFQYKKKFTDVQAAVQESVHDVGIVDLKFSYNDKFVASIDVDGKINVQKFDNGVLVKHLFMDCLYRSYIDWHPWENLLVIGGRFE